jgi:hypothetical protein
VSVSIIVRCDARLDGARQWAARVMPYTYLCYRTLLPTKEDDLITFATQIGYIACLIKVTRVVFLSFYWIVLLAPLLIDLGRFCVRSLQKIK